jgi:hypothetical protein
MERAGVLNVLLLSVHSSFDVDTRCRYVLGRKGPIHWAHSSDAVDRKWRLSAGACDHLHVMGLWHHISQSLRRSHSESCVCLCCGILFSYHNWKVGGFSFFQHTRIHFFAKYEIIISYLVLSGSSVVFGMWWCKGLGIDLSGCMNRAPEIH